MALHLHGLMEGAILDHSRRSGGDRSERTRSDGVRYGKCRGGEESRLRCIFGYLLVAGTENPGPHRARQDKRKVLNEHFPIPPFSSNR